MNKRQFIILCILLITSLFIMTCFSLSMGSIHISVSQVIDILQGKSSSTNNIIILKIRTPRIIGSMLCGAILSLSGIVFQSVFQNNLADPYLLGISSGSSLAISIGTLTNTLGVTIPYTFFSFLGSISTSLLTIFTGKNNKTHQILCGITFSSFFAAINTLLLYLKRDELQKILFWQMGSFTSLTNNKAIILSITLITTLSILLLLSSKMDLLLIDQDSAYSLGTRTKKLNIFLLLIASLATSITVSYCGPIGFIGLIAPHIARKLVGVIHKRILIITPLIGALIILISDTLARCVLAPAEIPVGVITAIIGSPIFLSLIHRKPQYYDFNN